MNYNETHKFVAIVNEKVEVGKIMNAVSHASLGLVNKVSEGEREKISFISYTDKDGVAHDNISALSLIVLKGRNGEIKKCRKAFVEEGIPFVDFLETMTGDTYKEQLDKTAEIATDEHNYFALVAFGEIEKINPITRKLSLYK
ncbi:MAG: DUF2000 domain-containing protein [Clostridiales bacterium]|jgi:hypothetical protein|nr:DUF2000 domain-containing protein [Clostridiales bacterium]